jgi:hypothetical protein
VHGPRSAAGAAAPSPAAPDDLAAQVRPCGALASEAPESAAVSRARLRRDEPRPEPGAGVLHAGSWAGASNHRCPYRDPNMNHS